MQSSGVLVPIFHPKPQLAPRMRFAGAKNAILSEPSHFVSFWRFQTLIPNSVLFFVSFFASLREFMRR
jgi:hypothetical protein